MARILALDIGTKRTGVAFLDEEIGIPLPLTTLHHASDSALLSQLSIIIGERRIDRLIVGMPLLLSGEEGAQAALVRAVASKMQERGWQVTFRDERYTTPRKGSSEPDTIAALNLF